MFANQIDLQKNIVETVSKKNGLGAFEAPIFLLEEYLHNFGIVDLDNPQTNPLALVELHDKEGLFELYLENKRMDDYMHYRVWDNFHISFDEFMGMPRHRIEAMLSRLRPALKLRLEAMQREEQEQKKNER